MSSEYHGNSARDMSITMLGFPVCQAAGKRDINPADTPACYNTSTPDLFGIQHKDLEVIP
jgi:hypothetical protein